MKDYVKNKNEKDYDELEIDTNAINDAYKKQKASKYPTSVNLPENVVSELKEIAIKKGIPYQVLMRMIIVEGLEKLKQSA